LFLFELKEAKIMNVKRILSFLSVVAMVAVLVPTAYAANLTSAKDTLSNSAPDTASNHGIQFTTPTGLGAGNSFKLVFPVLATEFDLTSSALGVEDFDVTIASVDQTLVVGSGPGASEIEVDLANVSTGIIVFDMGSGVSLPASSAVTIEIGTNATSGGTGNTQIVNPSATGSYSISLTTHASNDGSGASIDENNVVVSINNTVNVTATVQSSLTFTINGITSGTSCPNSGGNASVTTTSTTIPYGNLATSVPKIACQQLVVSTNASNGYIVTVQQNQDLTSGGADTIKAFSGTNGTPVTWTAPPGAPTNGYFGYTTDDTGYAQFQPSAYAGFTANNTPYNVVTAAGPVSNETNYLSYEVEVNQLQEAGTYTNTLMYICTATF
jgi:hypothetical protein